ncbi:hypothetical protein Ciccas_000505 [Cichlidogyrus casuarinus]|uniref:Aminotransferase class V domain-containing protein n=1 Tax=Cichlidogyrus casuarinus TaxID=1844966 RepID=A0ABD2QMQ8_9PLAT
MFIESFIVKQVLPQYANTHTTTSATGLQTSFFRSEAKDIVRNAVRALDSDAVIFVGSGSTGAVSKLLHSLSLQNKPVVIVGPYEHHSNLLPWRHYSERWYRVAMSSDGSVSLADLEELLCKETPICKMENRKILVCMNAASNVTGILTDVDAVCSLVHAYDAYIFFDYATAAPYVKIDMNPVWCERPANIAYPSKKLYKDAIFFSGHKFIGGPQSSGVLIVKKNLLKHSQDCPEMPGGGTVFLVSRSEQFYLSDVESREEAGTPAIIEDIRTGLTMKLKQTVGVDNILNKECNFLG